jgi:hypothetical protein
VIDARCRYLAANPQHRLSLLDNLIYHMNSEGLETPAANPIATRSHVGVGVQVAANVAFFFGVSVLRPALSPFPLTFATKGNTGLCDRRNMENQAFEVRDFCLFKAVSSVTIKDDW